MDCNSYIIVRKPTAEDQAFSEEHPFDDLPEGKGLGVGTLSLTSEGHRLVNAALNSDLPGKPRQFINTDKLEADFKVPEYYHLDFGVGDMEGENGWVQYRSSREGDEPLRLDFRCADYLFTDGLIHVDVVLQDAGYMRKPFRLSMDEGASEKTDGTLVLTSDNFAGADVGALRALLGEAAMDQCCKVLLPSDMALAEALKAHTASPEAWEEAVINVLGNPLGVVVMSR
jgi:hypothetical protein